MNNIKWIFFDIGSVLVDESQCYKKRYSEIVENTDISVVDFENKVKEYARQNKKGDYEAAKFYGLSLPKWHKELEKLYPDVEIILSILVNLQYKLGIIANQSPGTVQRLENWGILKYFDVVMASAEEGIAKPDLEIFKRALLSGGCLPENAVMVGDRLDNDIVPANRVGMKTIWIKQGFAKYAIPKTALEMADYSIDSLKELIDIFGGK